MSPETSTCICGQLTYDKETKNIHLGKESLQKMVMERLDSHMQKNENWTTILHHIQKLTQNGLKT